MNLNLSAKYLLQFIQIRSKSSKSLSLNINVQTEGLAVVSAVDVVEWVAAVVLAFSD
jgi:hypothetical protein